VQHWTAFIGPSMAWPLDLWTFVVIWQLAPYARAHLHPLAPFSLAGS